MLISPCLGPGATARPPSGAARRALRRRRAGGGGGAWRAGGHRRVPGAVQTGASVTAGQVRAGEGERRVWKV